jgi:diguanylate cyclase (GGDEF)-like protein
VLFATRCASVPSRREERLELRKLKLKPGNNLGPILTGLLLLCLFAAQGVAQRYSFRSYTQGLGNLNITCLAQDHTGYLWVGTQNGLYRYDGSQFQRFGVENGMPDRIIDNLYVGPDGTVWVGTTTGVYFERQDGKFSEIQSSARANEFTHPTGTVFTANSLGEIAVATKAGAFLLRRVRADGWTAQPMNLEGGSIASVLFGPDGSLWFGCDKDLCKLAGGKTTHLGVALSLPEEDWQNLMFARNGHLWLRGMQHAGEVTPDGSHFIPHDLPGSLVSEPYPVLTEDAQGRVLTAVGASLALWENDHWRIVSNHNGLSQYEIQHLFVDREGSVWMGVVGHGLMRWVGEDRWEGYTAADGLNDDLVWAIQRDHQGRLWIGTESGLDWIPAGSNTPKAWNAPGVQATRADALEVSADGAIWAGSGSQAGNLIRIDPKALSAKQWKVPTVYGILGNGPHCIWVATINGLYSIDPIEPDKGPQLVVDPAFLTSHQRVTDMSLDPKGHLWVTSDQGLLLKDESGWHRIDPGQSGAFPDLIAADWNGNLWAAGPSQDLMRIRVSGYKVVEAEHIGRPPILSQEVVSLVVDHRGWLWVGQDAGVTVYDGKRWRSFTQDDGLIWNDTDSFSISEDRDGSMWIGTSGGLSHLIAPQAAVAGSAPAPAFSEVTYGGTTVTDGSSVKWGSNTLSISMASLSFKDTNDIGIRYRLVGEQGGGWEDSHEMTVRFRRLSPGSYRFEVAAVNATGTIVSPVASLSFRIVPLWWQNRYMQAGVALLVILIVVGTWRRRVRQLLRQKRHLEEAVRLRTIDLEREKTELVRTREQMRHFAEHDGLTGLWNHRIIVERLRGEVDRSLRDGTPLSIILVDLDHFKGINDMYGHMAGDQALKETGAIFHRAVRSYDWVGRYGGEEFLLILPGSALEGASLRAEELRALLQKAQMGEGEGAFNVTASFGVASGFPTNYEAMIQTADAALYRAKNKGRNCVMGTEIGSKDSRVPAQPLRPVTIATGDNRN